jgi:hypothetical protein
MPERPPPNEFGKRRRPAVATAEPVKRSGHVALLLMGTLAVGGSAYALTTRRSCEPTAPGMAAPALPDARCGSSGSSGGGHGGSSHFGFYGDSSGGAASGASSDSASGSVTRGGFGSLAHAFGFSGGG